jgi:Mrp family chromosome partitioning ATPase
VAPAAENLYLASATSPAKDESIQLLPANFHNLVPRFKASDFDYVIFDTPPVDESSTSLVMASFMDKVLLVVESEKSTPGAVKRAQNDLLVAKADISVVFNKAEPSGPRWLNEN